MGYIKSLNQILDTAILNVPFVLTCLLILWLIQIANIALGYRLNIFGIMPRRIWGLVGILFAPLLHGGFSHLFMNSFFFFFLASIVLIKGKVVFWTVTLVVAWIEGLLVWCLGRHAIHVGMSGVIVGYWSYSMANAYLNPSFVNILGAGIGFLYFGIDLLASMVPSHEKRVSTEGHFFGGVAGVICAYHYPLFAKALKPLVLQLVRLF